MMVGRNPVSGRWYVWHKVHHGRLRRERLRVFIRRMLRENNMKAADDALWAAQKKGFNEILDIHNGSS